MAPNNQATALVALRGNAVSIQHMLEFIALIAHMSRQKVSREIRVTLDSDAGAFIAAEVEMGGTWMPLEFASPEIQSLIDAAKPIEAEISG